MEWSLAWVNFSPNKKTKMLVNKTIAAAVFGLQKNIMLLILPCLSLRYSSKEPVKQDRIRVSSILESKGLSNSSAVQAAMKRANKRNVM